MAKVGRKRKPTALKLIEGNPGKRPINEAEPEPDRIFNPDPPEGLNRFEVLKWRELTAQLSHARILTVLDLDAIEIYCREWCALQEAVADVNERGKLLRLQSGGTMWNPSWTQLKHSQSVCRSIMAEFGMTPSSRSSLVVQADKTGRNSWDDY
jgi:P27 family predicted phage terminase small subunit